MINRIQLSSFSLIEFLVFYNSFYDKVGVTVEKFDIIGFLKLTNKQYSNNKTIVQPPTF